jgi:hypothetical protein
MLAQSFKSAADLGITEPQRDALCKTLVLLETGKLTHSFAFDFDREIDDESKLPFSGNFNMRYWTEPGRCGTIACIGGTATLISGVKFGYHSNNRLRDLFQPAFVAMNRWSDITPAQAATALRSYLTTGDAKWHEAIA